VRSSVQPNSKEQRQRRKPLDLRKIKKLIELVEESGIAELEVKSADEAVRITMNPRADLVQGRAVQGDFVPVATQLPVPGASAAAPDSVVSQPAGRALKSPLSGTFYAAPTPDAAAFVSVGDQVASGQVLCIVESMKMMNRIEAERAGVVTAVLAANGEPVESGQPLFLIDG